MRAVLLAGGLGTRFAEETDVRPKPMIEIGGKPILWHIMKIYSSHGINDFIICLGYKGYVIKEYFSNYFMHQSNVTFDLRENTMEVLEKHAEPWKVTLIDTGEDTMIGGRIKKILPYIGDDDAFCVTYGDGVADIDIDALIAFHQRHGGLATVTAVTPPGRYGALLLQDDRVVRFSEKPPGDNALINGGFFVLHPDVLERIAGDDMPWETEPLESATPASGSPWTRCATGRRSRRCGRRATRHGRRGRTDHRIHVIRERRPACDVLGK